MENNNTNFEKRRYMLVSYWQQPNGSWEEVTEFKNQYKNNDLKQARVILDLQRQTVIKNALNPTATFDDMIEFYKRLLGDQLTPYL
jgi:hypothetical protein